jgi:multicomponent Na+:H+ antiporter subunit A
MFGVPPFLGFFAKEEIYAGVGPEDLWAIAVLAVLVLGNALLGAAALAVVIRPFMGTLKPTPQTPHEGGFALWIGPALFGLLGLAVVFAVSTYGEAILAPMATSIHGKGIASHLSLGVDLTGLPIWLSLVTWALGGAIYWQLDRVRTVLLAAERRFSWSFDTGFDQAMFGLVRFAGALTRLFHHGRLELYLMMVFAVLGVCVLVPLVTYGGWPSMPDWPRLTLYEWGAVALATAGVVIVVAARTRLGAIIALGIQGLAVSLIFLYFGAPDLGLTQLLVETLSVVILALVMTRLHLGVNDPRPYEDWLRDGTLAVVSAVAVTALLLRVLEGAFDPRLSRFFEASSFAIAHGRNIVNVILVDFRGLDTLGEISVVMTAGIAILALLRRQHKREALPKLPSEPQHPVAVP